ncbi:MAG TPA: hypothetical protein VJV05_07010 [Pyrinomonadaceae bacterium]|nr:hypothetical protein [Pyrinomonadaceae bacterium]
MHRSNTPVKLVLLAIVLTGASSVLAQKGIDTQTTTIKTETNKTTTWKTEPPSRSFDWGKGKTEVRDRLPNPYKLAARRDVLIENIMQILKDRKMVIDEASSRLADGIIITQPFVFAKGPVSTQNALRRYGVLDFSDTAWSRGQYTLLIEVQSIDGVQNNVAVNAKVEGRAGDGVSAGSWTAVPSSGLAEDEFLAKIVEMVTGEVVDKPAKPTDQ